MEGNLAKMQAKTDPVDINLIRTLKAHLLVVILSFFKFTEQERLFTNYFIFFGEGRGFLVLL